MLAASICLSFVQIARAAENPGDQGTPRISNVSVAKEQIVVEVAVPAGVKRVTLESRTRIGNGAWIPRAVQDVREAGTVSFRLSRSETLEVLRVRADSTLAAPASFFLGQTNFNAQVSTNQPQVSAPDKTAVGGGDTTATPGANNGTGGTTTRTVVESDIWQIDGDTLYFFNQYRGLQVLSLENPDQPVVKGTLSLPASGEQMYVLDEAHVLLLARSSCGWSIDDGSQGLIVRVENGQPKVANAVSIPGYIQESRMVGTALYVISQAYRRTNVGSTNETWEWGSVLSSFDLANPEAPKSQGSGWYAGYGNAITATDRFLFVASLNTSDWRTSSVRVVDISDPSGALKTMGTIAPAGQVADKFKMSLNGDVLTVISQVWNWQNATGQVSVLETFSLADPSSPVRLGRLELGRGESLYATRFDGDRVYVVTFLRIDPLWVVDLRDPRNPRIAGEVQVPGYSSFIQPLGDRLVTIGVDTSNSWKVAVSLFDVANPASPALLSRVSIGETGSWSEANWDEKALSVLPDAGLILVPYSGWGTNGYAQAVQLIDLDRSSLTGRGIIAHELQPRRATVHENRVLSISGRELLAVNVEDRDHPKVTTDLQLSWPVQAVELAGNYLVEISGNTGWYAQGNPVLRVAPISDPNTQVLSLEFTNGLPIVGTSVRDGKLYVAQSLGTYTGFYYGYPGPIVNSTTGDPNPTNSTGGLTITNGVLVSVFDLGQLPSSLPLLGTAWADLGTTSGPSDTKLLWPRDGALVVASQPSWYPWFRGMGPGVDIAGPGAAIWWPGWSVSDGNLLAFDVSNPNLPLFKSRVDLSTTNGWWNFGDPIAQNNLVYLSHQAYEFVGSTNGTGIKPDGTVGGYYITRYWLDVVDYTDIAFPTPRPKLAIPGTLIGLSHQGSVLYTQAPHWNPDGTTDWLDFIDASAYDGVRAPLVASMKLGNEWPRTVTMQQGALYLGVAKDSSLQTWRLSDAGQFALAGNLKLPSAATEAAALGGSLAIRTASGFLLVDTTDPASLTVAAQGNASCWYGTLAKGTASAKLGLWIPLGDYGVIAIRP